MCLGNTRKNIVKKKGVVVAQEETSPQDYSHIFNEIETQLIIHRALLMQRLFQDPFYLTMNVSTAARLWMLRHLAHLAEHAELRYHINLMQFFEYMGREEMLSFLRYKNAPKEMVTIWNQLHPAPQAADFKPKASGVDRRRRGQAKERRV